VVTLSHRTQGNERGIGMTTGAAQQGSTLDWGAGKSATLFDRGNGRFELVFAEEVPPPKKIKIDAIDQAGKCRPLMVSSIVNGTTVTASGQTEGAWRARVYIIGDDGPLLREAPVPGAAPMKHVTGPEGGTLIMIGHDGESATAEVVAGSGEWKITFEDEGKKIKAPRTADVEVEAIGPVSAPDQVRPLTVAPGPDSSSLRVTGNIAGASYIRLAIRDGNHWHTRCVPLGGG
jgi:hypothetical protein